MARLRPSHQGNWAGARLAQETDRALQEIDSPSASLPIGTIVAYGGATAPDGWLICNGSQVSRDTYSALYDVIGDAYGAADPATFTLPALGGKAPIGKDMVSDLGETKGSATHTHELGDTAYAKITDSTSPTRFLFREVSGVDSWTATDRVDATSTTTDTGNYTTAIALGGESDSGSSLPPSLVVNYIIYAGA